MKFAVVGGTGATGSLLVKELLQAGHTVKVIVRSLTSLEEKVGKHSNLEIQEASLLDLDNHALQAFLKDCDGVASCLGHNLSFKGIYGKPRKLVRDSVKRLCEAIEANAPSAKLRFVLMNTSGNRNKARGEKVSFGHKMVVGILRALLPPHPDNEQAARHLQKEIGNMHPHIEWAALRPDGLIDEEKVTEYEIFPSPTRDPIFNAGKTSRINVAHFMARLLEGGELWNSWKFEMPVIYNSEQA